MENNAFEKSTIFHLQFFMGRRSLKKLGVIGSMYSLQPCHLSVLVGILLSDGYFNFPKCAKNASVGLEQSFNKFQYLFNVFWSLSHYCAGFPVLRIRTIKGSLCYSMYFILPLAFTPLRGKAFALHTEGSFSHLFYLLGKTGG